MPESAQYLTTTVDVVVGNTTDIEFVADEPGDWALHCHKTHHIMNGMAHDIPNMIGVNQKEIAEKIKKFFPDYMPMGTTGMGEMFDMSHHMKRPPNFLAFGSPGPYSVIEMGGMFTILKVREGLSDYSDPGWYGEPVTAKKLPSSDHEATSRTKNDHLTHH